MDLYLGLDGGGTKTILYVGEREGPPLGQFGCGGTSLSRRSLDEVRRELASGCELAFGTLKRAPSDCVAVCGGFASAGIEENRRAYELMLRGLLPRARVGVITDAELAWRFATGGSDGIVVVAGTGSIAWGRYGGRTERAGGEGPGRDAGSADWIGREAVAAGIVAAPAGDAYAGLLPRLESEFWSEADPIFRRAGVELAGLLAACARKLDWAAPAAYAVGGVFDHVPAICRYLRQAWPHSLVRPWGFPVEAALKLARSR